MSADANNRAKLRGALGGKDEIVNDAHAIFEMDTWATSLISQGLRLPRDTIPSKFNATCILDLGRESSSMG
ncbi:hypothetical protein N7519_000008 [Penicillium mononematosum]|uniref:uncharacterized protein n=1 Tax=Penicillium mononematosum TaxID=268346 RepID=UPI0025499151|nr:uncharacterized protein N7519_000008 [Penicillium mononematosum]KAJ6189987.1 hypothetical protein N7519_000008 [Penicillium mononematosum]